MTYHHKHHSQHYKRRRRPAWRSLLTVCAVVATVLTGLAAVPLVSPSLFMAMVALLPPAVQDALFWDFFLRGGSGLWEFAGLAIILWVVRAHVGE